MMNTFGPRQVETSSWQRWIKEAIHFSGKHLALNVCLVLATIGLFGSFPPLVLIIVSPVLVGVFVLVAYSADTKQPVLQILKSSPAGLLRILLCSAATVLIMALVISATVLLIKGSVVAPESTVPYIAQSYDVSDFMGGSKALFTIGIWLLAILPWFAIPLFVCTSLSLRMCLDHTFVAFNQNKFVVVVVFLCVLVLMGGALFHGLTVVPLYPVLGGLLYASYRHIFLGLPPAEPQKEKIKVPLFARFMQSK
jgi:hypothetical protein